MKIAALIEKVNDNEFQVHASNIKHTITGYGKTVREAKADFENSVKEMIESYRERTLPKELQDIQFTFKYDISSVFSDYDFINVSKFADWAGISPSLLRQYKSNKPPYISKNQIKKIENAFHQAAKNFAAIRLIKVF